MIVTVSNAAQLSASLAAARSGDTIQLAAGDYGLVSVKGLKFDGNVTITSADPNHQAVLRGIDIRGSAGITLSNVEIDVKSDGGWNERLMVTGSERIVLTKLDVHGSLNGNPGDDGNLALIRDSKNVTVSNSEFYQGGDGISFLNVENFTVSGNDFHDLRTDGVRGGGAVNVQILNNRFTDFYPAEGDHPDAIQFWTTNTTETSRDILIQGNIITRGKGEDVQGIFLRDQQDNLPYQNVTITGNFVAGTMYNGLMVDGGRNVTITDNVVLGMADQASRIRLEMVDGVTLTNNVATQYINNGSVTNVNEAGNKTVSAPTDGGAAMLQAFLTKGIAGVATSVLGLANVMAVPGKVLAATTAKSALDLNASSIGGRLEGTSGADSLADTKAGELVGGEGDDKYSVTRSDTRIIEHADGGIDTVASTVDYVLGDNIETLRLVGTAIKGTGNALANTLQGNELGNLLRGLGGDDRIDGRDGNDTLHGDGGNDYITGGEGMDQLFGGDGDDRLFGDAGADTLNGGAGSDALTGGAGIDWLYGGAGADKFQFGLDDFLSAQKGSDVIGDFSRAEGDKIYLNGIDANTLTAARDKFAFIATQSFTKLPGQLRYEVHGNDTTVLADVNGDGVADLSIILKNVTSLSASDFVF